MKITKNLILFISSIILGLTIINCSSDDGGEDTTKEDPKTNQNTGMTGSTGSTGDPEPDLIKNFVNDSSRKTIVFQAEDIALTSDWKLKTDVAGYNGTGYIVWEGPQFFWKGIKDISILTHKIQIDEPGIYEFKWRSVIAFNNGESNATTEHNDSFLNFSDADDFFTYVNRDFVFNNKREKITKAPGKYYPNGSDKSPKGIAGESAKGYMKIFMNSLQWKELSSTWDHNGFRVYAEFKTAGEYTMNIAARSSFHGIDEMKLIPVKLQ